MKVMPLAGTAPGEAALADAAAVAVAGALALDIGVGSDDEALLHAATPVTLANAETRKNPRSTRWMMRTIKSYSALAVDRRARHR